MARSSDQRIFFSTSQRCGSLEAIDGLGLIPALFAPYRELARLRHDFPLVLARDADGRGPVSALSALVDQVQREMAPKGMAGDRLRKQVHQLEREIRERSYAGESGLLSELWFASAATLARPTAAAARSDGAPAPVEDVLRYAGTALKLDGEVIRCDRALPARVVTHAWEQAHQAKAAAFRRLVDELIARLSDILRAAFVHSQAGVEPEALRASVGSPRGEEFDFNVMSKLVGRRAPRDELPAGRRRRIERALAVLRAQRFFPERTATPAPQDSDCHEFRFSDCDSAATAFHVRLPELVETVKAIAIAELEADGRYDESLHDGYFENFGDDALSANDLALFPDYLVCIAAGRKVAPENGSLMGMLSSGLPVKVLVEVGDVLEEAAIGSGKFAFGVRSNRLAMTATTLGGVFVLQTPASNLFALRERLAAGLRHRGPTVFSVFAGSDQPAAGLPVYLTAAASMASRAFPSFSYDPYAGDNLAARFSFENNPQPELAWPVAPFEYADEQLQRVIENTAFTFADFAVCDQRYAGHFARVPKEYWDTGMLPVADWLALDEEAAAARVPYILAVDSDNVLHRVLVDARLMQQVRRCLLLWHRLQEMGGIHNSHAERLLARERTAWESQRVTPIEVSAVSIADPTPSVTAVAASSQASPAEAERPAHDPDQAWIETARCPSCNECQLINDKMFLYNANKQAYIGDLKTGTYRQMVEAAESCQVSIIHPGKPWNPDEPGLDDLVERAKPFL